MKRKVSLSFIVIKYFIILMIYSVMSLSMIKKYVDEGYPVNLTRVIVISALYYLIVLVSFFWEVHSRNKGWCKNGSD